jgi:hypothetical protein
MTNTTEVNKVSTETKNGWHALKNCLGRFNANLFAGSEILLEGSHPNWVFCLIFKQVPKYSTISNKTNLNRIEILCKERIFQCNVFGNLTEVRSGLF